MLMIYIYIYILGPVPGTLAGDLGPGPGPGHVPGAGTRDAGPGWARDPGPNRDPGRGPGRTRASGVGPGPGRTVLRTYLPYGSRVWRTESLGSASQSSSCSPWHTLNATAANAAPMNSNDACHKRLNIQYTKRHILITRVLNRVSHIDYIAPAIVPSWGEQLSSICMHPYASVTHLHAPISDHRSAGRQGAHNE